MVIDIEEPDLYLVIGKRNGHYWAGKNSAAQDSTKVSAKWTEIDGKYIGFWIEDGYEYYFSFSLPKKRD